MELSETRGKKEGNADETKAEKQNCDKSSIKLGLGFFYASNTVTQIRLKFPKLEKPHITSLLGFPYSQTPSNQF